MFKKQKVEEETGGVPSLLAICTRVVAEYADGLTTVDFIPDDVVMEILQQCSSDTAVHLQGVMDEENVPLQGYEQKLTSMWEKRCKSQWDAEKVTKLERVCAYDISADTYWKQLFLTGYLQDLLDSPDVDVTDEDCQEIITEYISKCQPYVYFLTLCQASAAVLTSCIGKFESIQYLDLSRGPRQPKLKVEGGKAVADWLRQPSCRVKTLKMYSSVILDPGCDAICEAIEAHPTVLVLDLQFNDITDKGYFRVCTLVEKCAQLVGLDMRRNMGTMKGRNALKKAAEKRHKAGHPIELRYI
eukprot:TRINITY_DN27607_c0_g1_i1.p1 TRINITY_DN27607_c0_g1~~TRINITY_DN27607_c0_g1_i1.p1  ORF type:complete len:300 (-),score=19.39 TRINITY_DN27607_c0_g1_i1:544-1443(-)